MKKFYSSLICMLLAVFCIAQPSVQCDTVIQTSTCAGGNVIVPFTVTGGNFSFGNVFKAQLSDWLGGFANPVNIGQITWFTSGFIWATIPINTNFSIFYRIRVIATNPIDTSNVSPNPIFITTIAQLNTIIENPLQKYICPGDSLTLTAINIATSYSWSTGDTTQSIVVYGPGIYTVTTTDALTCQSTTSDTIYTSCTGITENELNYSLDVFPNPSEDRITIHSSWGKPIDTEMTLLNPIGEILLRTKWKLNADKTVDVTALSAGIYFLQIEADGVRVIKKIVIR